MSSIDTSYPHYLTEGTAVLKDEASSNQPSCGVIIEFPQLHSGESDNGGNAQTIQNMATSFFAEQKTKVKGTWLVSGIMRGSVQGKPVGHAKWWEVASASAAITVLAFLSIFFGA